MHPRRPWCTSTFTVEREALIRRTEMVACPAGSYGEPTPWNRVLRHPSTGGSGKGIRQHVNPRLPPRTRRVPPRARRHGPRCRSDDRPRVDLVCRRCRVRRCQPARDPVRNHRRTMPGSTLAPAVRIDPPKPLVVVPEVVVPDVTVAPVTVAPVVNQSNCRNDLADAIMTITIPDISYSCSVYAGGQKMLNAGAATLITDEAIREGARRSSRRPRRVLDCGTPHVTRRSVCSGPEPRGRRTDHALRRRDHSDLQGRRACVRHDPQRQSRRRIGQCHRRCHVELDHPSRSRRQRRCPAAAADMRRRGSSLDDLRRPRRLSSTRWRRNGPDGTIPPPASGQALKRSTLTTWQVTSSSTTSDETVSMRAVSPGATSSTVRAAMVHGLSVEAELGLDDVERRLRRVVGDRPAGPYEAGARRSRSIPSRCRLVQDARCWHPFRRRRGRNRRSGPRRRR